MPKRKVFVQEDICIQNLIEVLKLFPMELIDIISEYHHENFDNPWHQHMLKFIRGQHQARERLTFEHDAFWWNCSLRSVEVSPCHGLTNLKQIAESLFGEKEIKEAHELDDALEQHYEWLLK
jgi:hypothetical protein